MVLGKKKNLYVQEECVTIFYIFFSIKIKDQTKSACVYSSHKVEMNTTFRNPPPYECSLTVQQGGIPVALVAYFY